MTDSQPTGSGQESIVRIGTGDPEIDTSVPHSARVWNYFLGGKDNYEIDRAAGDMLAGHFPGIRDVARVSRYWLARVVRHLAGEAGVRQFLDVGTGLPTVDNTHEIAQRLAPDARIVYVDNDPLVLAHARALLTSTPEGQTSYIDADLHDPAKILETASGLLDFDQPIALMLIGVIGHVADYDKARSIVGTLVEGLPSGSYLALYDCPNTNESFRRAEEYYTNDSGGVPYHLRPVEQIVGLFDGLELVEPGVVDLTQWRPETPEVGTPAPVEAIGGIGRKP